MVTNARNAFTAIAAALAVALVLVLPVVAYPADEKPNAGEITEAVMQGLGTDPVVKYVASSAGTAVEDLIATASDLTALQQADEKIVQNVVVENFSTTISVCVCSTTWAAACSAAACSCRGGAAPKMAVAPGKSRAFRYDNTRRLCAVTSAIAGEWQAERSVVTAGAR